MYCDVANISLKEWKMANKKIHFSPGHPVDLFQLFSQEKELTLLRTNNVIRITSGKMRQNLLENFLLEINYD